MQHDLAEQDKPGGSTPRFIPMDKLVDIAFACPFGMAFKLSSPEIDSIRVAKFLNDHKVPCNYRRIGDYIAIIPKKELRGEK